MPSHSANKVVGHQRIDHTFRFPMFDYDAPSNFQPCLKIQFFFSKLLGVSSEHFHKHYAHVHSDLTVAAKSFGAVQRYTQHQTPEMKEAGMASGLDMLDYDGCSTLWFRNWEDAKKFLSSPEYVELTKDCDEFMDKKSIKMFAGHELICFGKAIPDIDVKDGVTKQDG